MSVPFQWVDMHWAPLWLPLNWRNETSGQLARAVDAYLDNRVVGTEISVLAVEVVRDYLIHYIHAPCWTRNFEPEDLDGVRILTELRYEAMHLDSPDAIGAWIRKGMEIGLDPL